MTMAATRPSGTGVPSYTETWPCEPESAKRARSLVTTALGLWGIAEEAETGALIVSELASNAINHSRCRLLRVTVTRVSPSMIRISVSDKNRAAPVLTSAEDESESGRGLQMVDLLSTKWGYDRRNWGKIVWAELAVQDGATRCLES